ncbi:hypothetical protein LDENG_00023590 [Lucifuga dentata]|nr:hypothetical protein LDENG_00023590 [Lucifuga dentata]
MLSSEEHLSGGQSSSSPPGHAVASSGLVPQESSWIGLLSVVSKPALSFLQKYLPGRARSSETAAGWFNRELKHSFVDEENEFLRQLDDIMPQYQGPLRCLRCQHDGAAGLLQPAGGALPWLTADSLQQIGIQDTDAMHINLYQPSQTGYLSTARTFLSQVLLSSASSQEVRHPGGGQEWASSPVRSDGKSGRWWGSFWGSEGSSLWSDSSWDEEGTLTYQICPHHTKAPAAKSSEVFSQSGNRLWTVGENTGQRDQKDQKHQPANNENLHTAQTERPAAAHRLSVTHLTPDLDNGYSSLEEEHFHICHLYVMKTTCEEQPQQLTESTESSAATTNSELEGELSEEGESVRGAEEDEAEGDSGTSGSKTDEEEETVTQEGVSAAATVPSLPQCQNKTIAFIMGCPCSDDDSCQSDGDSSDDDDDDGFDSEGLTDSADEDDEEDDDDDEASDSESEADSETERLWTSFCQSKDPYNPKNFTAHLHTGSATKPKAIPTSLTSAHSTPDSSSDPAPLPLSAHSTPDSSSDPAPLPLSPLQASPPLTFSSSPPQSQDSWDDSTSASEADEAESLRLWRSFSSSSDPYSLFDFRVPCSTGRPTEPGSSAKSRSRKASTIPAHSPRRHSSAASPPQYRKEEAEERLDSGFSEPSALSATSSSSSATPSCVTMKKVRFCEDVEEFFASCGEEEEDRHGPWEELARDRCRFLRRCQDVEQSIAYCLQPRHRSLVYRRLTVFYGQDD